MDGCIGSAWRGDSGPSLGCLQAACWNNIILSGDHRRGCSRGMAPEKGELRIKAHFKPVHSDGLDNALANTKQNWPTIEQSKRFAYPLEWVGLLAGDLNRSVALAQLSQTV